MVQDVRSKSGEEKEKSKCRCVIHVVANLKDKVSAFAEQSWNVQPPCFRIYYMRDLLRVLTFQAIYILCILSNCLQAHFQIVMVVFSS